MRRLINSVAPVIAAAAFVLAGASSALAAGPVSSASLDQSFCYPPGATTTICYDITGSIHYVDSGAGSAFTLEKTTRTTKFEAGVKVGSAFSTEHGRGVFAADGTVVIETIMNTRSTLDGEPCTNRLVLRLVDYEAVVYRSENTCL